MHPQGVRVVPRPATDTRKMVRPIFTHPNPSGKVHALHHNENLNAANHAHVGHGQVSTDCDKHNECHSLNRCLRQSNAPKNVVAEHPVHGVQRGIFNDAHATAIASRKPIQ